MCAYVRLLVQQPRKVNGIIWPGQIDECDRYCRPDVDVCVCQAHPHTNTNTHNISGNVIGLNEEKAANVLTIGRRVNDIMCGINRTI